MPGFSQSLSEQKPVLIHKKFVSHQYTLIVIWKIKVILHLPKSQTVYQDCEKANECQLKQVFYMH